MVKLKRPLSVAIILVLLASGGLFLGQAVAVANDLPLREGPSLLPLREGEYVPNQIIVKFKAATLRSIEANLNDSLETREIYTSRFAGFKVLQIPEGKTVAEMVATYSELSIVEYAEPNYIRRAIWSPNDPNYSYQWHFDQINLEAAWDLDTTAPPYGGDPSVIVAILDTGIAYEDYDIYVQAPDLADTNFWQNPGEITGNSVDDDGNGYVDDIHGWDFVNDDAHPNDDVWHGTHVCGTIAQSTNNTLGVAGIAFNTTIMPLKVIPGGIAEEAEAIYYATDKGAHIINMSIGGPGTSSTEEDALAYAYEHGVTIICAAGNDYEDGNDPEYPAAYDDYCIAVGATRYDQNHAYYSNTGSYLDIVAPGGDMTVDQNRDRYGDGVVQQTFYPGDGTNPPDPTNFGYLFAQGTSMACPHVSGVAALMLARHPSLTTDQVREALQSSATDLGNAGWDEVYGWGLLNASAALLAVPAPSEVWVDDDWAGLSPGDPADGHTFGVDAFATIQDGIDNALAAGDSTVYVAAGTYYEIITLMDGVDVLGAGADVTTIDGGGDGPVVTASGVGSTTELDGFTITNGYAYGSGGGGMYSVNGSALTVSNCIFHDNSTYYHGGGIYNVNASPVITNCTFADNSAGFDGGGMCHINSWATVTNCIFSGNSAGDDGGGMYIYNNCSPTLTNCTFANNSATGNGDGMCNEHNVSPTVTNCILWDGGDEIYNYTSAPVVTYCDVEGSYGGAGNINADPLFVGGGDYHLQPGSPCIDIGDNSAPSLPATDFEGDPRIVDGDNDTIAVVDMGVDEHVPITEVWVDDDFTPATPGWGYDHFDSIQAGIDAVAGSTVHVAAGIYYENITLVDGVEVLGAGESVTTIDGGGSGSVVTANSVGPTTVLDGFTITNGSADNGGGMYNDGASPTVTNCTFSGNYAGTGGGMYNFSNSSPVVTNCTFSGNSADYNGGGMFNNSSSPTVTDCTFSGNSATNGGGMYNFSNSSPVVTNCDFLSNSATNHGGGMYDFSDSSSMVTNCTFTGNSATNNGGGMANDSTSSSTVSNCTFTGNSASSGGGMYIGGISSPTVTECTFDGNTATDDGGGMANFYSSPTVTNCTFSGNSANVFGGGMFNNYSSPTVTDCTFSGNSANRGGGMANAFNSSPTVTNCTFTGNSASSSGGGMFNGDGSSPTVTGCTFSGNSAVYDGGGMNNDTNSSPTVTNCILWGNGVEIFNEDVDSVPVVTYCDVEGGYSGTGNIDADPLFVGGGDFHLQAGSPCIDAGDNSAPSLPATDFEGDPRIVDGDNDTIAVVDMGVDEYVPLPILEVSPATLDFSATQGYANPDPQYVNITNGGGGTLNWTATDNASWLDLNPASGTAPSTMTVSVNITGLAVGSYSADITVTAPGAVNSPQTVTVNLDVYPPPVQDYYCDLVLVSVGSIISGDHTSLHSNDGSYLEILSYGRYSTSVDWYGETTIDQSASEVDGLFISYSGKYSESLTQKLYLYNFTTSGWDEIDSRTVGTTDINTEWTTYSPEDYISGEGKIRCRIYVLKLGLGSFTGYGDFLRFQIETAPPGLDYIIVTPGSVGVAPGESQQFSAQGYDSNDNPIPGLTYSWDVVNGGGTIDSSGLFTAGTTTGTFTDTVEAEATYMDITRTGYATVTVSGPVLEVSPTTLYFGAVQGYANPDSQYVNITNSGGGTLNWTATEDAPWLDLNPTSGTAPSTMEVSADITGLGLAVGSYSADITVTAPGAVNSPQTVTVNLSIISPPPPPPPVQIYYCDLVSVSVGSIISGDHTSLHSNDDSYLEILSYGRLSTSVDWYGETTIDQSASEVDGLFISYSGKYSESLTQKLYLYNFTTSGWDEIDSRTVGTTDINTEWTTYSPEDYISGEGKIRCRIYVLKTGLGSFTGYGDRMSFVVILKAPSELDYIIVTPGSVGVAPGESQQFSAQGYDSNDNPIPGLTYSWDVVNGGGTIDSSGLFTAGTTTGTFTDTVEAEATYMDITRTGYATVTVSGPVLEINPTTLDFNIILPYESEPGPVYLDSVSITNAGGGTLNWTATEDTPWLLGLDPSSGTAPSMMFVYIDSNYFDVGDYSADITVTAPGAVNSPQTVMVNVHTQSPPPVQDYYCDLVSVSVGSIISGDHTSLHAADNSYLEILSYGRLSTSVDWYGETTIDQSASEVTGLLISYSGKYSESLTQKLYLYNFTTSGWDEIDSRTVGTTDINIEWTTYSPEDYISGESKIRCRIYVLKSGLGSFTGYGDFLRFTISPMP